MDAKPIGNALMGHVEKSGRINGPHTEAKWAQHLLGTEETAGQRKRRLMDARLNLACQIVEKDRKNINERYGKFTSKPKIKAPAHV